MADVTERLALPLLIAGQAQKERFHNEALAALDIAVQAVVVAVGVDTPPGAPAPGQCWIVGGAPGGDWAVHGGALAGWTGGGWRFVAPFAGMTVWDLSSGQEARHDGSGWIVGRLAASRLDIGGVQVVGPRRPAIASPVGGATVDVEARDAIAAVLAAMTAHGLIAP